MELGQSIMSYPYRKIQYWIIRDRKIQDRKIPKPIKKEVPKRKYKQEYTLIYSLFGMSKKSFVIGIILHSKSKSIRDSRPSLKKRSYNRFVTMDLYSMMLHVSSLINGLSENLFKEKMVCLYFSIRLLKITQVHLILPSQLVLFAIKTTTFSLNYGTIRFSELRFQKKSDSRRASVSWKDYNCRKITPQISL